ncbi:hypothetical protein GPALN_014706 [Globodera pallida]|nr:hypothetical protein GPALN_014706 [Globodera pallida]
MSYSSAVLCRSSSSSSSAFSEASAPPSSTSSSSSCSSCSSPPRGYVPRTTEESKRVPKRQQRWKRWRNESSQPVFVRSSSSSLHSLDSASSNSSGIGTSGAETPPATVTTPPLSASTEVQQQHPEQARTSSSLSGKSGVRGSDGLGTAAHYSVPMELEKFEDLSLSHCSLPSGHSTTLPEPVFLLDLSHPILQQFYLQQRLFYRQIYAQQLAALSARLGLAPSSVEETVFDPLVPHQHLGFPPAPPPVGQMANLGMFFNSATNADASSPHCDQALPHDAVLPTDCSPAAMAAPFSSTDEGGLIAYAFIHDWCTVHSWCVLYIVGVYCT